MPEARHIPRPVWPPGEVYRRRLGPLAAAKLGKCSRCLRSAVWLTGFSWVTVAGLLVLRVPPLARGLALLVALAATTLLLAHLIAFSRWMSHNLLAAQRALPPGSVQRWSRREWALLVARLTIAHLVATVRRR